MAFYGMGTVYDNEEDATQLFVRNGLAALGWAYRDAPTYHEIFKNIQVGDIIYLMASPSGRTVTIRAVGIVVDNEIRAITGVGEVCIRVRWIWQGNEELGEIGDKYNIRHLALYEEPNPEIKKTVLELLFRHLL